MKYFPNLTIWTLKKNQKNEKNGKRIYLAEIFNLKNVGPKPGAT